MWRYRAQQGGPGWIGHKGSANLPGFLPAQRPFVLDIRQITLICLITPTVNQISRQSSGNILNGAERTTRAGPIRRCQGSQKKSFLLMLCGRFSRRSTQDPATLRSTPSRPRPSARIWFRQDLLWCHGGCIRGTTASGWLPGSSVDPSRGNGIL